MGDRLDDQHPRHHRIAREVADKERLVHRHALDADDGLVRLIILGPVDKQERVAVGNPLQDFVHVDVDAGRRVDLGLCHSARFPDVLRSSHAVWRMN